MSSCLLSPGDGLRQGQLELLRKTMLSQLATNAPKSRHGFVMLFAQGLQKAARLSPDVSETVEVGPLARLANGPVQAFRLEASADDLVAGGESEVIRRFVPVGRTRGMALSVAHYDGEYDSVIH